MPHSVVVLGLMGNSGQNISSYQVKKVGIDPPITTKKVAAGDGLGWTITETAVRTRKDDDVRYYTEIHFDNAASFAHALSSKTCFECFEGPVPLRIAILGHGGSEETRLGWEQEVSKGGVDLDSVSSFIALNLAAVKNRFTESAPLKISLLACEGAAWHDPRKAFKDSGNPTYSMAGRLLTELQQKHQIPTTVTAYWRSVISSIQDGVRMVLKFGQPPPEGIWQLAKMTFFNTGIAPYTEQGIGAKLKFVMRGSVIDVTCKNSEYEALPDDEFVPLKAALCTELMKFQLSDDRDEVVKATRYGPMYEVAARALVQVKKLQECIINPMKCVVLQSLEGRLRKLATENDD